MGSGPQDGAVATAKIPPPPPGFIPEQTGLAAKAGAIPPPPPGFVPEGQPEHQRGVSGSWEPETLKEKIGRFVTAPARMASGDAERLEYLRNQAVEKEEAGQHRPLVAAIKSAEYGVPASVARMVAGAEEPTNTAAAAATPFAPEVILPYFGYQGMKAALTPRQRGEDTPAMLERRLGGAATVAGAGAGMREAQPMTAARYRPLAQRIAEPFRPEPYEAAREVLNPRTPAHEADIRNVIARPTMRGTKNIGELRTNLKTEANRIWEPYNRGIQQFGHERIADAGDVIANSMKQAWQATDVQRNPSAVERVRAFANKHAGTSYSVAELEQMRQQARADLSRIEAKYPSEKADVYKTDPEWRAIRAEKGAISDLIDKALSAHGINTKAIRADIGPVKGVTRLAEKVMEEPKQAHPVARTAGMVGGAMAGSAAGGMLGHAYLGAGFGATLGERLANRVMHSGESPTSTGIRHAFRRKP